MLSRAHSRILLCHLLAVLSNLTLQSASVPHRKVGGMKITRLERADGDQSHLGCNIKATTTAIGPKRAVTGPDADGKLSAMFRPVQYHDRQRHIQLLISLQGLPCNGFVPLLDIIVCNCYANCLML